MQTNIELIKLAMNYFDKVVFDPYKKDQYYKIQIVKLITIVKSRFI